MKLHHCIETAKKNRNTLLTIGIITLVILTFAASTILADQTTPAQLNIETGTVLVNGQSVTETTKTLKLKDIIETKDTTATIILYESVFVILQPNTQVTIEDLTKQHPKINQQKGTTWNKFTKLLGVSEYTVQTKTSVASVRGTAFELSEDKIITAEGEVLYTTQGKTFTVQEMDVIEKTNGQMRQRKANNDETAKIQKHFEKTAKEIQKIAIKEIKQQNKINEKQTKTKLEKLNQEIRKINEQTKKYQQKIRETTKEKILIEKETTNKKTKKEETQLTNTKAKQTKTDNKQTPEKLATEKPTRQTKTINEIGRTITRTAEANKNNEPAKTTERTITKTASNQISRNTGGSRGGGNSGGSSSDSGNVKK